MFFVCVYTHTYICLCITNNAAASWSAASALLSLHYPQTLLLNSKENFKCQIHSYYNIHRSPAFAPTFSFSVSSES